jgi:phosphate transport system substrate-binding protein
MRPYQDKVEELTGHKLRIVPSTAQRGLLAVLQGEADLAMIAAPLDFMVVPLRKSNPNLPVGLLRDFRISKSRVAFPVNPDNPVRSVSVAKLKQVLNGQIDNWRQLGGPDLPIHVISLPGDSGPKRATEEAILAGQRINPHSGLVVENAQEIVKAIVRDRGAIGFTPASFAKLHGLPVLQINISITQSYGFVTRNEPTDAMREVIAATRSLVFEEEP